MGATLRQRVFERLMAGETIDQIRRDISSVSSLQRGIQRYVEQWRKDMPEFQKRIKDLELREKELEDDLQRVFRGVRDAESRGEDLERDLKLRRDEVDELDIRSVEVKSELGALISELDSLRERGVTEEAIVRVGKIDFGSNNELLERINTVERHNELVRSNKIFSDGLMKKKDEYKDLQLQIETTRELREHETNALDEAVRSRAMYLGANKVVQGFIEAGYDTKLLMSLLEALRGLSVKGQPNTSIQRLTDGLGRYRTLMELEDAITKRKTEVSVLNKQLAQSQATLKAIEDSVLKVIDEAKDESIRMIDKQGATALKLSRDLLDNTKTSLTDFFDSQTKRLENARQRAEYDVTRVGDSAQSQIQNRVRAFDETIRKYETVIRKWGEEKEELGRLKDVMRYAQVIHDALELKDSAGNVPLEVMALLVRYVRIWIHEKVSDAKIQPYDEIADTDSNIRRYQEYKLTTLIRMLELYFFNSII